MKSEGDSAPSKDPVDESMDSSSGAVGGTRAEGRLPPHQQQQPQPQNSNDVLDARDEEDVDDSSHEDPFTYSDDSASLSDAYFCPQPGDELAWPARYRRDDEETLLLLRSSNQHHNVTAAGAAPAAAAAAAAGTTTAAAAPPYHYPHYNRHNYPMASYYGSLSSRQPPEVKSKSPFMIRGAIQEDAEVMTSYASDQTRGSLLRLGGGVETAVEVDFGIATGSSTKRRDRRKAGRRSQRWLMLKRREQIAREMAVVQIRGQVQDVTCGGRDLVFAALFVLQLIVVLMYALWFVYQLGFFSAAFWSEYYHWGHHHQQDERGTAVLTSYHSTGELQYTDDAVTGRESLSKGLENALHAASTSTKHFSFTIEYHHFVSFAVTCLYALILTMISFGLMLVLARSFIHVMLVFSILLAIGWGLLGLTLDPYGIISVIGSSAFILTLGYTMYNWNRIPFAATNLHTALCGMRSTADIALLGLGGVLAVFGWVVVWTTALMGVVNSFNRHPCHSPDDCRLFFTTSHIPVYLLMLFSFHWTYTVLKNVVRTTVASAIGTWWFYPADLNPMCTLAVWVPLHRSLTKSFGSICLGSLVVQPVQILFTATRCCGNMFGGAALDRGRHCTGSQRVGPDIEIRKDDSTMLEEHESVTDSIGLGRQLIGVRSKISTSFRSCNKWSFCYIGMYGYSFSEAGERALQLFETREWLEVVKDCLIENVLLMASVIIGGSTGTFAALVEEREKHGFTSAHGPTGLAFVLGSVLGYVLSNIFLLGVVGSSVNTVLVCFAAGPFEFDMNHPQLSREMRESWTQHVWEPAE